MNNINTFLLIENCDIFNTKESVYVIRLIYCYPPFSKIEASFWHSFISSKTNETVRTNRTRI